MKLSVHKDQIIEGLQKAATIIPAKAGAAYLRCIWLKAEGASLSIMSTDANIEFTGKYPAEVAQEGLAGVQGRSFVDLVRQLPSGVLNLSLDKTGTSLLLEQGRRSYRLPVSTAEWFQNFSDFPAEESITWTGSVFGDYLDKVSYCINDDDAQEAIACLFFNPRQNGRIDVCGLNGHQFAVISFIYDELFARLPDKGLLIQKKYLPDIKKWLGPDEIELNFTEKRFYLRRQDGAEMLSLPRALHDYPDYNVFVSKLDNDGISQLTINRKEAMEALGRIQVFNSENERCVFFDLKPDEVNLSAQGQDIGYARESLEAKYKGDIEKIAFPTKNLMEIFGHFTSENLQMSFTGEEGPCGIIGPDDMDYMVIIMPMKASERPYYSEDEAGDE